MPRKSNPDTALWRGPRHGIVAEPPAPAALALDAETRARMRAALWGDEDENGPTRPGPATATETDTPRTKMLEKGKYHERNSAYYDKNKERIKARRMELYWADPLKYNERSKKRYRMNKDTQRYIDLKKHYGLEREQYDAMVAQQSNRCLICGNEPGPGKVLAVDHDHDTGKIRGLLCRPCNAAIGAFKDSAALLQKAIDYINHYTTHTGE